MPLTLLMLGALLAAVGYLWLCILIVRELEAKAVAMGLLLIGCFSFIAIAFAWYFSFKRWDVAKKPFLIHLTGLLIMAIGSVLIPPHST